MCLSLSATVILFCLFLPKLRVVLLRPDKNVRSKSKTMIKSSLNNTSHASIKLEREPKRITTGVPVIVEKSLTLATAISSGSVPSSPGFFIINLF